MNNINYLIEHLFPGITGDITKFFKDTKYINSPLGNFDRFQICSYNKKALYVIPKELESEDLNEVSSTFNFALSELGHKYGLELKLPSWAYEK